MARKEYLAQWRDENGRHRLRFATKDEADTHKARMVALKAAKQLGIQIAEGAAKGPGREQRVATLTRKCSKIAHTTARQIISIDQPAQISA